MLKSSTAQAVIDHALFRVQTLRNSLSSAIVQVKSSFCRAPSTASTRASISALEFDCLSATAFCMDTPTEQTAKS